MVGKIGDKLGVCGLLEIRNRTSKMERGEYSGHHMQ